ncbi:MAG: helix-turn-helix domain-containing protein [Phycisphaerales bacterium]|nr:helix-turn-helix domain-containing protein [Phycisphaerales bacterium]
MVVKAQHSRRYRKLPGLLRDMREGAALTQRQLGERLRKPQSWVHNCEVENRRVDLAEFCDWCTACEADPVAALRRFLNAGS